MTTELTGDDARAHLPCGCRVEVLDDGIHIYPCSAEHDAAHEQAIAEVIEPLGIPVERVYDQ